MEITKNKKLSPFLLVVILFAVFFSVTFLLYQERGAIYAGLNNLKLIPQPERFTELYFENPTLLPKQTVAGQPVSFSFTVHNLESVTTTYPYKVYFEYPLGQQVVFANNSVSLANNAFSTITVSHTFLTSNQKGKVVVELISRNQLIDFLLPNNN